MSTTSSSTSTTTIQNTPPHENTTTSRNVRKIEDDLNKALLTAYEGIKKDLDIVGSARASSMFPAIMADRANAVRDALRAAITEIISEAGKYLTIRSTGLSYFPTEQDILLAKDLTQEFEYFFWTGMQNEFIKHVAQAISTTDLRRYQSQNPLDQLGDAFIQRLTASLASRVLSEATIQKLRQLNVGGRRNKMGFRMAAAAARGRKKSKPQKESVIQLTDVETAGALSDNVMWSTQEDERVCPICAPLDGMVWPLDDPGLMSPVRDSHINCRCRLLSIGSSGEPITE